MKYSYVFGIAFAISALIGGFTAKDNKFMTNAILYGLIGGTSATAGFAIGDKVFKSNEEFNTSSSNNLSSNRPTTVPRYNNYNDRQAAIATDRYGNRTRVVSDTSDDYISEVPQFELPDVQDWGTNNSPIDNSVQEVNEQSKPWSIPDTTSTPEVYTVDSPPPYLAEPAVQQSYTPEPYQAPVSEPYQTPYTPDTSPSQSYDSGPSYTDYS
jgi:hypothetical protein